ncbi:Flp pilus assembly protein CpaB, partial [Mesorhizobium sp.]
MIGIAAVFGAISIFAADFWVKSQARAQSEQKTASIVVPHEAKVEFKTIVVANAPLRYGMQLDRSQLTEIPWPQDSLPQGAFPTVDKLLAEGSRVVLSPIEVNEPVLLAKLSGPNGRATLSNMLSPGMRAVTIRTDEIAGVGGFITPGDRVDVVLTRDAGEIQEVSKNAQGAAGSTVTSEIVVSDAKVLSVGQGADERKTEPQVA